MKKKLFVLIGLFALLGVVSFGVAYAQAQKDKGNNKIQVAETEYDFGEIMEADGPVSHTFTVKNVGNTPLVITRVNASCGCTKPEYSSEPIAAGASSTIKVTYNPAGRPGQFVKTIAIYSNGMDGALTVRIKGVVK